MRRTLLRLAPPSLTNARVNAQFSSVAVNNPSPWSDPNAEIEPGQHVISVCKEYNITTPEKLRQLRGFRLSPNPYRLGASFSQQHCFGVNSMKYFDKLEHPFAKSLLDIYIERKKQPLWITCFAHGAGVFPNKKAQKKVAHALRDALAAAGYDPFGRRVLADGESSNILDLYGTLRVTCQNSTGVCDAKFVDLLKYANEIIASFAIVLRRDQNGRHIENHQQQRRPTYGAPQGQKSWPGKQQGRIETKPRRWL